MQNDLLALGFITSKSSGVLFRVESSTSGDYLQLEMVSNIHIILTYYNYLVFFLSNVYYESAN